MRAALLFSTAIDWLPYIARMEMSEAGRGEA
jgi:hypothetical protein